MDIKQASKQAKEASVLFASVSNEIKNKALENIADTLRSRKAEILSANKSDLEKAEAEQLASPLLKRLKFDDDKIGEAIDGIKSLIGVADPVGKTIDAMELDEGLELFKVSCPIGVVGIVFESRPDALVQISTLCLKSGNAVLMKGGSEAFNTNKVLADLVINASYQAGIPKGWLTLLEARSDVLEMLAMDEYIDMIIPRGSNEFVQYIMENTNIPVLGHADGICHVYVDSKANIDMAIRIIVDSKTQYVAVCNAVETVLIHKDVAGNILPKLKPILEEKGVELRGCAKTLEYIDVKPATEQDWGTEYLDLIMSIKIISNFDEAVNHINKYGSRHTDVIVTSDKTRGIKFMDNVDSADVFFNCSSRFSDGFRYGLGAEVGISTSKLHARGPVGLEGLMIYKWRLIGDGHIVGDYSGPNARIFTHKRIQREFS